MLDCTKNHTLPLTNSLIGFSPSESLFAKSLSPEMLEALDKTAENSSKDSSASSICIRLLSQGFAASYSK